MCGTQSGGVDLEWLGWALRALRLLGLVAALLVLYREGALAQAAAQAARVSVVVPIVDASWWRVTLDYGAAGGRGRSCDDG